MREIHVMCDVKKNSYLLDLCMYIYIYIYIWCGGCRAASSIYQFLMCKRLIEREMLPPLLIRNVIPLCMAQYEKAFSMTRSHVVIIARESIVSRTFFQLSYIEVLHCLASEFTFV